MVYFPPEVMDLIFSFHNPYLGIEKKVKEVYKELDKKLFLTDNGIFTSDTKQYFDIDPRTHPISYRAYKNIAQCITEIPQVFESRKPITTGSYGGKHCIERYRDLFNPRKDNYISNGEFIMAMLISKYKMKKGNDRGNSNWSFFVKSKNI